ncbi:hypothetical protein L3Q82_021161, partial [Scortum barcoo]
MSGAPPLTIQPHLQNDEHSTSAHLSRRAAPAKVGWIPSLLIRPDLPQKGCQPLLIKPSPRRLPDTTSLTTGGMDVMTYVITWLRRHDPDNAPSEAALRDQLLLGLQEGPLAQALKVYARRNPEEDFAAIHQEALLLDTEYGSTPTEVTTAEDGLLGYVRPARRGNVRIPPKSEVLVWGGWARMGPRGADYCALVEALSDSSDVGVARTLAVVRICNPHPYSLSIGQYEKLGKLYHIDEADVHGPRDLSLPLEGDGVVEVALVDATAAPEPQRLPKEVSDLTNRPDLSEHQQKELRTLLLKWEKVFAKHDEDFGRMDLVQHRIHTGDTAPIRESETAPPADESGLQKLGQHSQVPIPAYADYSLPFILYTDASNQGLGAVLAQVQEGQEHVIAYASRGLHPAERNDANYSSFKLELLALKYRSGRSNVNADALLRSPVEAPDTEPVDGEAVFTAAVELTPGEGGEEWADSEWEEAQASDPDIQEVKRDPETCRDSNITSTIGLWVPPAAVPMPHQGGELEPAPRRSSRPNIGRPPE